MNKLFLTILALVFLSSCQKDGQGSPQPLPVQQNRVAGPSDGGGGDTCNGRMIESYKIDITQLEEYKEFIQPIMIRTTTGQNDQAKQMPIIQLKSWYLIDCKLEDIPKDRKGLYLETYQTAIQTTREIYIDASSYNKMAKEEKAKLLMHEMIMSLYLLKYTTLSEICKISGSCTGDIEKISDWKMFRPKPYVPLNSEDHQKIRNVTAWLWSNKQTLDRTQLNKVMHLNDFDTRFNLFDLESSTNDSKEVEVDIKVIVRMLKEIQWTNALPQFCNFDPVTNISLSTCQSSVQVEFKDVEVQPNFKIKNLSLKLKIVRSSDKKEISQEFLYPIVNDMQKVKLYINKVGNILNGSTFGMMANWPGSVGVEIKEGLKSQMLLFMLNVNNPDLPEIYQVMLQSSIWYAFETELSKVDGLNYKTTWGYSSLIPEESENLFMENELPFKFGFSNKSKQFIKMELVP